MFEQMERTLEAGDIFIAAMAGAILGTLIGNFISVVVQAAAAAGGGL